MIFVGTVVPPLPSLPWDGGNANVVGVLIVLFLLYSFGIIYPRQTVKRLEDKNTFNEGIAERQATALEKIANHLDSKTVADETVARIMAAIKDKNGVEP